MTNQGKLLKTQQNLGLSLVKSLHLLVNINLLLKIVICCNIFLSQYCVQKYLVRLCPDSNVIKPVCFLPGLLERLSALTGTGANLKTGLAVAPVPPLKNKRLLSFGLIEIRKFAFCTKLINLDESHII